MNNCYASHGNCTYMYNPICSLTQFSPEPKESVFTGGNNSSQKVVWLARDESTSLPLLSGSLECLKHQRCLEINKNLSCHRLLFTNPTALLPACVEGFFQP